MKAAVEAIRSGSGKALRAALSEDPALARHPRLIAEAGRFANAGALRLLLTRGADPDGMHRGYRALHSLIQEHPHAQTRAGAQRLACLELLLHAGASLEACAAYPPAAALLIAAFSGEAPFVERLLGAGARVDAFADCALGHRAALRKALGREPELAAARSEGGLTPLHCCAASRMGRDERGTARDLLAIATLLLDAGADPNARVKAWSEEVDVAYFAIGTKQRALVELLLARGADPTAALPTAAWSGGAEYVELVLAHGADLDVATHGDNPLLNDLIRWGQVEPALDLLARGASPDLPGRGGWTALHQAVSRGNLRLVRALLEAGADRAAQDDEHRTPHDVALEKGRATVAALLG